MDINSQAAEQLVRMTLDGTERTLRITGRGAEFILSVLYRAVKEHEKEDGKGGEKLKRFLASGERLDIYEVPGDRIEEFTKRAKENKIKFSVIKVKEMDSETQEVLASSKDGGMIKKILYEMEIDPEEIKVAKVNCEKKKEKTEDELKKGLKKLLGKEEDISENPFQARTGNLSVPSLRDTKTSFTRTESPEKKRPSVKAALLRFEKELKAAGRSISDAVPGRNGRDDAR